jgi:hypothetical protein
MEALKSLINNGYLEVNEKYIDMKKAGPTYSWVIEKMNEKIINETNAKYPLWCWVKCYNNICPPKHKGEPVEGFDVKITFNKKEKDTFITDFRRYSFLLNNMYIPNSIEDKNNFDKELKKYNITAEELKAYVRPDKYESHRTDKDYMEICKKIRNSFDRCITTDSDILQGCVWRINLNEIEKIEILNDKNYRYGSLNYKRSNGTRKKWINEFYNKLEK